MKIGLVSPYDFSVPGGVNQHIIHLADQFRGWGHDVRIVAPSSVGQAALGRDDLTVIGRPYPVPADGSIARMAISLRLASPVKAMLAKENFDIIHVHEPLQGPLPITVLRLATCITIGTFHAFSGSRFSTGSMAYYYGQRLLKRWFRKLAGKIAVSEAAAEYVGQFFPGYYNIIPNGIDYPHFSAETEPFPEYQDGKINVVFVGRLDERRKGLRYLLRAFQLVQQELPNTRLIIVGRGDRQRHSYERWADQAGLNNVHFTGFVSYEDLPRYYRTADIFCAPNTGDESFGIILLEAMASGRPIVASNIRGFAAVLTDGVEGVLVAPKDERELAHGIIKLANNPDFRRELGENGRIKSREFSWDRVARRVFAYYERIRHEIQTRPPVEPARRRTLRRLVGPLAPYMGFRR